MIAFFHRHLMPAIAGFVAALWPLIGLAAEGVPEYELKAAFVYNFIQFIDWPEAAPMEEGALTVCASPGTPLYLALSSLAGKNAHGKKIAVRPLVDEQPHLCQVAFLALADRERLPQLRKSFAGGSVLLIGDSPEINREGVIIALAVEEGRIVFDIDASAARRINLSISSRLLRLARSVQ